MYTSSTRLVLFLDMSQKQETEMYALYDYASASLTNY